MLDRGDVPESNPAEDARGVIHDLRAVSKVNREFPCVTTTNEQTVKLEQCVERFNSSQHPLAPLPVPDASARLVAQQILKRAVAFVRNKRELKVWSWCPV